MSEETEPLEEIISPEETISLEESTENAFEKLRDNMPSIGIISRKKRIKAYIEITSVADYMISHGEMPEESALFILSMLMRKCSNFQKAAIMTAFSLASIGKGVLSPIGLAFSLEMRKNLNLPITHHTKAEKIISTDTDKSEDVKEE